MTVYREIRAGSIAVTIVTGRDRVWVAATLAGSCASAEGMRHGMVTDRVAGLTSKRRWRPVFAAPDTTPGPSAMCWTWLKVLVNAQLRDTSASWPSAWVARRLAERIRRHLNAVYRNG